MKGHGHNSIPALSFWGWVKLVPALVVLWIRDRRQKGLDKK